MNRIQGTSSRRKIQKCSRQRFFVHLESPGKFKKWIPPKEVLEGETARPGPSSTIQYIENNSTKDEKHDKQSNLNHIKIIFTNADELTPSKLTELKHITTQEKPPIIAVSETKFKRKDRRTIQDCKLENFTLYHSNLDTDNDRDIGVYIHDSISHRVRNILDENFKECYLVFGCFYRSPTVDNDSDSNKERLNSLIDALCRDKAYSHNCLLGDFNFKDIK